MVEREKNGEEETIEKRQTKEGERNPYQFH